MCGGFGHHIRRYLEISVRGSHSSFLRTRRERGHKGNRRLEPNRFVYILKQVQAQTVPIDW